MIEGVVRALCKERGEMRGVSVVISVPDGLERARKTLNARLGVIGGLSILGTTGIVKPYSTEEVVAHVLQVNTARHFQELMLEHAIHNAFGMLCQRARHASQVYTKHALEVDVLMCDFDGSILGYAGERDVR